MNYLETRGKCKINTYYLYLSVMMHTLDVSYSYDFLLFGISCHESSHRLCWFLNTKLGVEMEFEREIQVPQKAGRKSGHEMYRFYDEENSITWSLINNRTEHGLLLPEIKQVDYFLKVEDEAFMEADVLKKKMIEIPVVMTCFNLKPTDYKSKDNLIFD